MWRWSPRRRWCRRRRCAAAGAAARPPPARGGHRGPAPCTLRRRPVRRYAGDLRGLSADLARTGAHACCSSETPAARSACATSCARTASPSGDGSGGRGPRGRAQRRVRAPRAPAPGPRRRRRLPRGGPPAPAAAARGARSFLSDFRDLKVGDLVVHQDHGIGRFQGLETLEVGGAPPRVHGARLPGRATSSRCPVEAFDRVQKYASAEGARPVVDKLGSGTWEKTKRRVKKAMRDMAAELLKLYAERKARPGPRLHRGEPLAARVRGGLRVRGDARPGGGHRRRDGGHVRRTRPWTASSAATSATARPRWPCARPCGPCWTASRWRCWPPPPCSPSSTGRPSASASRRSPSRWRWCRASARRRRSSRSSRHRRRARWTSSSAPTACSPRTWPSATSACSSSTRSSASAWRPRRS